MFAETQLCLHPVYYNTLAGFVFTLGWWFWIDAYTSAITEAELAATRKSTFYIPSILLSLLLVL